MKLCDLTDEQIMAVIDPIMDNLMQASARIDHAAHTRDFTDRLRAIVTPEHLQNVCRRYQAKWGLPGPRERVGVFRRSDSVAAVWKQWLSESDDEFVAELVLIEEDGRYLVDHVVFF